VKVWVYINNNREVGDVDHLRVFANEDAAEKWFAENDPEGVAFMYDVIELEFLPLSVSRKARLIEALTLRGSAFGCIHAGADRPCSFRR
jgi:hypothetical protein